jgi:hypothetical protein
MTWIAPDGYEPLRYRHRSGTAVHIARFQCDCRATHEVPIRSGSAAMPASIIKVAERAGWELSPAERLVRCPTCAKRNRTPLVLAEALKRAGVNGAAPAPAAEPPPAIKPILEDTNVSLKSVPPAIAQLALPREATTAERGKIRGLLDANFDDATGAYLAGYSDQRIADEVKVPRAIVTRIREVGYGAIKQDPELAAVRAELAKIRAEGEALVEHHTRALDDLRAKIAAAEARLGAIEKGRAA